MAFIFPIGFFDDSTDKWKTATDDNSLFFYRNHIQGEIVLEISLAELNHILTTELKHEFLLLDQQGKIVGKQTSLDDIDPSLIEEADAQGISFHDYHTIIPSRISGLYLMIFDANKAVRTHMKSVVIRALMTWGVITLLIAFHFVLNPIDHLDEKNQLVFSCSHPSRLPCISI